MGRKKKNARGSSKNGETHGSPNKQHAEGETPTTTAAEEVERKTSKEEVENTEKKPDEIADKSGEGPATTMGQQTVTPSASDAAQPPPTNTPATPEKPNRDDETVRDLKKCLSKMNEGDINRTKSMPDILKGSTQASTDTADEVFKNIAQPGGFRRHYVLSKVRSNAQPGGFRRHYVLSKVRSNAQPGGFRRHYVLSKVRSNAQPGGFRRHYVLSKVRGRDEGLNHIREQVLSISRD
jgi:hypothetical protein